MKISADMQPRFQGGTAGSRNVNLQAAPVAERPRRFEGINNAQARQLLQNAPTENSLSNAMAIMNKARVIIQQALSVSSKLRSEAFVSLTSGSVNQAEIGKDIAMLNSSFSEFNASVSIPTVRETAVPKTAAQIGRDIAQLREFGTGSGYTADDVRNVEDSLAATDTKLAGEISAASEKLSQYAAAYDAKLPDVGTLSSGIRQDPAAALKAQGNISQEYAAGLI